MRRHSRTLAHADVLMQGRGSTDIASIWGMSNLGIAYLIWLDLHDRELEEARAMKADAEDQDLRHEAAMRRSEKLGAIGSEASFFSGLARIDGEFRSVLVAVTPQDFVLLDNWAHLDPDIELARLPRQSITDVVIVDESGNEVADQLIDSISERETPEEERYRRSRGTFAARGRRRHRPDRGCEALTSGSRVGAGGLEPPTARL
jgi:hypothetical protein